MLHEVAKTYPGRATGEVISGQGVIPDGFEHYILKYDDNSVYPMARLEYVYYLMAKDAGIEMMPSEIRSYGDVTHFLTRRFDRKANERIHTQTLAAMCPESQSYEDLFAVMRRLNLPYTDFRQQYLRMVFNVLAGNVDDHSKNVSFCMNQQGVWSLSPAYDLTFSVDLSAPAYMNRHSLTINGRNDDISRFDLEVIAQRNDIADYKAMIDQVATAVSKFSTYAAELDINADLIREVGSSHHNDQY